MKQQTQSGFLKRLGALILVYLLLAAGLFWIVARDWSITAVKAGGVSQGYLLPADSEITQQFQADMDGLDEITLLPHFDQAEHAGVVTLQLLDGDTPVWSEDISVETWISDEAVPIAVEPSVQQARELTLHILPNETGLALWAGTTVKTGRYEVPVEAAGLQVNGEAAQGSLVLRLQGHNLLSGARWFWPVALAGLAGLVAFCCVTHRQLEKGKRTLLTLTVHVYQQYRYLLRQLVNRDFRVKYKSSSLGMIWSFLNPLLSMLVYLVVFSTLFNSDVENFPVYLMAGIVCFSYFSEATNLGMASIVGNSALITKVYMPKLIYPLSKVLSSGINLCISFIPLLIVMLITGVPFHKSLLLLPVVVMYLILLCFGMSLILSTLNVFFRDTAFLWGVALTMLNFLTPIFYPETIIPAQLITIFHMNPLYQIIFFMRTIILDGCSPTPVTYLYCTLSVTALLAFGLWVFRRNQDRFVLYL